MQGKVPTSVYLVTSGHRNSPTHDPLVTWRVTLPKVSIYIGKALHRQLVDQGIPITRVCQVALAQAVDSPVVTTGTRIRGLAQALIEVAEAVDARGEAGVKFLEEHGVNVETLREVLPWLQGYGSGAARPGLAGVDRDGAVEGGDTV